MFLTSIGSGRNIIESIISTNYLIKQGFNSGQKKKQGFNQNLINEIRKA